MTVVLRRSRVELLSIRTLSIEPIIYSFYSIIYTWFVTITQEQRSIILVWFSLVWYVLVHTMRHWLQLSTSFKKEKEKKVICNYACIINYAYHYICILYVKINLSDRTIYFNNGFNLHFTNWTQKTGCHIINRKC